MSNRDVIAQAIAMIEQRDLGRWSDAHDRVTLAALRMYRDECVGSTGADWQVVAWAIYDSQGFYDAFPDEDSARRFCATYNQRADDPLRPYTCGPLYRKASDGVPPSEVSSRPTDAQLDDLWESEGLVAQHTLHDIPEAEWDATLRRSFARSVLATYGVAIPRGGEQ